MTKRIFRTIILVSLAVLLLSFTFVMGVLYDHYSKLFENELEGKAMYIAHGLENEGISYFDNLKSESSRITLIDTDGTVLYDNKADINIMDNHADREEIKEAMESQSGKSIRESETLSEKTVYYATRLSNGTILRVSSTQNTILSLVMGLIQPFLVILALLLILSGLLAYNISKRIVEPLNNVDFENPEKAITYEELSPLLQRLSLQNKKIEYQLREMQSQQEEFKAITENMSEGFIIVDTMTKVLSYNSSALKLLDVEENPERQSILSINRSENFREVVELALKGNHNEQKMIHQGRNYNLIANPVWREDKVVGAIIVIMDITEKEERENLRREFTANMSHELKTPLTSISGIAEILKNGIVKEEDIQHFAETIYNESKRLITLVEDILKISQLDENAIPHQKENVDLLSLTESVIETLTQSAKEKNITFNIEGKNTEVFGVKLILEEMIYNLCDNAIKYNIKDGKVTVKIEKENDIVKLTVSDTGLGIPFDEQNRVFERFYRVDKSHSKEIGGTGLGLSIVKHGAMYHNATIDLLSKEEKGTSITINFHNKKPQE